MEYAIVDLETTGGVARTSRVIEVAVYAFDGNKVIDEYSTLVNPGVPVPGFITHLTGITTEMLKDAPPFEKVADQVASITHDRVFVAHNVGFDYSFLRNEFKKIDRRYVRKRLCTVRLTRNIFPKLHSYSLGNLCRKFDIPLENKHRAFGDARATTALLKHLIINDINNAIEAALKRYSREAILPPNLPKEDFEDLPEDPGVYYFHDKNGKVIYVGKANSLRDRVAGHFLDNEVSGKSRLFKSEINNISYELCGNELVALLLESHEIKRLWPKYNSSQKRPAMKWALHLYEDQNGFMRLAVSKGKPAETPPVIFKSFTDGWSFLRSLTKEHRLCARLNGLQNGNGPCYEYASGICKGACNGQETPNRYNKRLLKALNEIKNNEDSFAVIGDGRTTEEASVVLVEKGKYIGYGFVQDDIQVTGIDQLKNTVTPFKDNPDVQRIIKWYLAGKAKAKVFHF